MAVLLGENEILRLTAEDSGFMWTVDCEKVNQSYKVKVPVFEVEGRLVGEKGVKFSSRDGLRELSNGGWETVLLYEISGAPDLLLKVYLRYFPASPFIRFRYELTAKTPVRLTKASGRDQIRYTGVALPSAAKLTEIQFSHFNNMVHSFLPHFEVKDEGELNPGTEFPGPIGYVEVDSGSEKGGHCLLLAYEHGAEYPDTFLSFAAHRSDGVLNLNIQAVKGNYFHGETVDREHPFVSPWFQIAVSPGGEEELLKSYRRFFLHDISENRESRRPYIYYNTWNFQERNNYFHNRKFLDSMHLEHILQEIDVAHRMGIDVYVIDTGWFNKTGDWVVNETRFPDGMQKIWAKLSEYGMKLGLWFNPTVAADTSEIFRTHREYVMMNQGKESYHGKVWETDESYNMCLASGFADYFIRKLVQLNREVGVTYFKWDGIGQYGCDSHLHLHGTEANTPAERSECYGYKMGLEMIRIAEEVTRQCPGTIVDFDITEGGRFVGLGFLAAGKYFLINNGPYARDFDLPEQYKYQMEEPIRMNPWTNLFFYPGVARPRFCRQGVRYDSFVPSILFLTHFLPDPPRYAQRNSLASLMLGGNGIWGDLLSLGEEDVRLIREALYKYKQVAEAVTASYPVVKGFIGSSPEIYEKILPEEARGIICFFTQAKGEYTHITQKLDFAKLNRVEGADRYEVTEDGRLKITVVLEKDEARVVYIVSLLSRRLLSPR